MSREENETIYRFDETGEPAYLWTASERERRRWERVGLAVQAEGSGWKARAPLAYISLRKPRKLLLSNARREELGARLAQGRAARLAGKQPETTRADA